jgi:hypothetical protein
MVQASRDSLQSFAHGVYVNQLGDTSDQLVRSGYGPNYARLVEIKKKYDPRNVLRLNQNIKPDSPSNSQDYFLIADDMRVASGIEHHVPIVRELISTKSET